MNRAATGRLAPVLARIEFDDDAGHHFFDVVKDSVTIGRGGLAYPVDIRIASSPDVSREHARIRRDAEDRRVFLIDLSSLGTTLNGRHVPKGYDEWTAPKRENGAETALPDSARIGLADTVFLEFGGSGDGCLLWARLICPRAARRARRRRIAWSAYRAENSEVTWRDDDGRRAQSRRRHRPGSAA